MSSTLAIIEATLKEDYLPKIREQVNNESNYFVMKMKDKAQKINGGGRNFHVPLHWGRNSGVASGTEMGTLPTAGEQQYKAATGNVAFVHGRLQVSNATIQASKTDEVSYMRNLTQEVQGLTTDLKNYMRRATMSDGSGKLSNAVVAAASNTIGVDNPYEYFQGQKIQLVSAGSVVATVRTVTAVDYDLKTITIDGAAQAIVANDYFVTSGSFNLDPVGLGAFVSNGILHGINPTTESWWKAAVMGNAGSPVALTLPQIRLLLDRINAISGTNANFMVASYGVRAAYESLLTSLKRFVNPMQLEGGYTALEYDGLPMITDTFAANGEIWAGNFDYMDWYYTSELDFMDEDGSMFHRVPNVAAYEATAFEYGTMICTRRNAFGKLQGILQATGY